MYIHSVSNRIFPKLPTEAAHWGDISTLTWCQQNGYQLDGIILANIAAKSGSIATLEWFKQRRIIPISE